MVESEEAVAEALLKAVGVDDHEPEVVVPSFQRIAARREVAFTRQAHAVAVRQ